MQKIIDIPIPDGRNEISSGVRSDLVAIFSACIIGGVTEDKAELIALGEVAAVAANSSAGGDIAANGPQQWAGVVAPAYATRRKAGSTTGLVMRLTGDDGATQPGANNAFGLTSAAIPTSTQYAAAPYKRPLLVNDDTEGTATVPAGMAYIQFDAAIGISEGNYASFQLAKYTTAGALVGVEGAVVTTQFGVANGARLLLGPTRDTTLSPGQYLAVNVIPVAGGTGAVVPNGTASCKFLTAVPIV